MINYDKDLLAKLLTLTSSTYAPIETWRDTRRKVAQKLHNEYCPNQLIQCDVCDDKVRRHEMTNHMNSSDNIGKHVLKLKSVIAEKDVQLKENDNTIKMLKRKIAECSRGVNELKTQHIIANSVTICRKSAARKQ